MNYRERVSFQKLKILNSSEYYIGKMQAALRPCKWGEGNKAENFTVISMKQTFKIPQCYTQMQMNLFKKFK